MKKKKNTLRKTHNKHTVNGKGYKVNKARFITIFAIALIALFGGVFLYYNTGYREASAEDLMQSGKFADGIKVNGQDIGGLTYEEARGKLDPVEFAKIGQFRMNILLDGKTYKIDSDDLNVDTNLEDTLGQAIVLGKTGNRWQRKKELSKIKKEGKEFLLRYTYDDTLMEQQLTKIQKETGMAAQDATVKIEGGTIQYIAGKKGIKIDRAKLEADISAAMDQNLEQFDIHAQTVEVNPTITVNDLKERLVKKSGTTTEFKTSTASRVNNVVKAAGLLNGEMIPPGGTFSINSVLGARTSANGWSVATAISSGKYIDDVGGGVCQVSSTLYNSAVKAGLEVVERRRHTFPVSYLPVGQDAAISTGGPDLKLKNNYDFPIFIVAYASSSSKTLDVMIYGPKNADGGSYVFKTKELENEPSKNRPQIRENSNLFSGEYVEIKPRKNRVVVERWTEYVIDGKVVRTEKMSTDSYGASDGEYVVGPGTTIDSKTGKPSGRKVSEEYLTKKRETTTKETTTEATTKASEETTTTKTTTKSDATKKKEEE